MPNEIWPPEFDFLEHLTKMTRALEELILNHNNLVQEHEQVKKVLTIQDREIKELKKRCPPQQ